MGHILTLISIALVVLCFIIVIYTSFAKEQRVLKYSRKPGRRYWYKVVAYHPLSIVVLILLYSATFTSVMFLREINVFNPASNRDMAIIIGWSLAAYTALVSAWLITLQQRVGVMNTRKFYRTFSKVFKDNEALYDANSFSYNFRCKITMLQIQLYSEERVTPGMALAAKEIFRDRFHVRTFSAKKLKKARTKAKKLQKKNKISNKKRQKKNSY